jgi:predicted component of type VI protein secretion system
MATLYQIGENGSRAEQWEVGEEPVLVGRKGLAKVSIEDEGVSRRHFVISRDGEDYVIKDLNSRNGTWVEGRRVSAEKLRHNDCIQAGRTLFLFAERPARAATVAKGPNGTVMIPAFPQSKPRPPESMAWQGHAGNQDIAAAAGTGC